MVLGICFLVIETLQDKVTLLNGGLSHNVWCHDEDCHIGLPDIAFLFALHLKYLENDSVFLGFNEVLRGLNSN